MPRLIARDSLLAVPWKNGGGITRQIACFPANAGLDGFDWRLSTATVSQDGAFSPFPGIDRRLYILEGAGLDLHIGGEAPHRVGAGAHVDFAGEADVHGALVDGPVTDLNIMVRRDLWRMDVTELAVSGRHRLEPAGQATALFVLAGEVTIEGAAPARRFDTLLFDDGARTSVMAEGTARLLSISLAPR